MPSNISSLRERVARVRVALLEPGADLAGVLQELAGIFEQARGMGPDTPRQDVAAFHTELAAIGQLARHGEAFWCGWGRLLGLEPAALAARLPAVRLMVEG